MFPHRTGVFWGHGTNDSEAQPALLTLGHINCFDYTIPATAVDGPLYVKIWALYPDGTESATWARPRRIDIPFDPSVEPEVAAPPPAATPPSAPPAPAPVARSVPPPIDPSWAAERWVLPAAMALIAGGLAILLAVASRTRARRAILRSAPPPR